MLFFESKGAPLGRKALKLEFKMLLATLLFHFDVNKICIPFGKRCKLQT